MERDPTPLDLPRPLDRVVLRCLAKNPDQRFQTARDLKAALAWAAEQPAPAAPSKIRTLWPVVAALFALLSIALAVFLWRATWPVEKPLMRFDVDLGPDALPSPRVTAAISPDGSRLAFLTRGPAGVPQLATRLLDQEHAILLGGTDNATDPFFSPDNQWIGFVSGRKLKKISVKGGLAMDIAEVNNARGTTRSR